MAWYRTGTVSVTANGTTVTGAGTNFAANSRVGDDFIGPDGRNYEITNIASATVLSLGSPYLGATAAGASYAIMPVNGYSKLAADELRALSAQAGDKLNALGTTGNYDVLPVTKGGTGGTDQATARAGLGLTQVGFKDQVNVWTQKQNFNTPPTFAGPYGGIQISNNNGVQLSQLSMDWGGSITTLYLDFYYNMVLRNSATGYPVVATFTPTGNFELRGYAKLGEQAPAIKQKLLTGICAGAAGQASPVAHGLTSSKIIGIQALVQTSDSNQWVGPGSDFAGYNFSFIFGATNVNLLNGATNSSGVFGKPFRFLVTYQE